MNHLTEFLHRKTDAVHQVDFGTISLFQTPRPFARSKQPLKTMLQTKYLRPYLQLGLVALVAGTALAKSETAPGSEWDEVRREMHAFHGIHPDIDEKVMASSTGTSQQAIGPVSPKSTDFIGNGQPIKGESRLRHRDGRRIQSSDTGCTGIYCFSASFRGRFGSSSFEADQLKLPGKKGACFTLNKDIETAMERIKFLDPSWNYSWGCKVRTTRRACIYAPALCASW
jgi:hypothetical protein